MVNLLRNYQRPLMFVVTVLIIIAFGLLYNGTQLDRIGVDRVYQIYGKALKQTDIERAARRFHLAQALGLNEMIMGLSGNAFSQDQAVENFIWNSYVLSHEANKLRINPTNAEVVARMQQLPGLQTNGQFDPIKYQEFIQNVLMPNGFTSVQLEELVRDELRLRELILLIGSTVDVTPAEFRTLYTRGHEKTHASVIRFNLSDFAMEVAPTEEQVAKYYEENLASLQTEEKRSISFVKIELGEEEKSLTGRERMDALARQSDRADNLGQELLKEGATFATAAEKMGLEVTTVTEFTRSTPPEALAGIQRATEAAFNLTKEAPESNPIGIKDGLVILHLEEITPSRPLTLEEARPRVLEALREEGGRNAMTVRANEILENVQKAMAEGKSFTEAAEAEGVNATEFPAFSLAEPVQVPDAFQVAEASTTLPVGGVSKVLPTEDGAIIIHVQKRDAVDETKLLADQEEQLPGLRRFKRYAVFNDWLGYQLKLANPHSLRGNDRVNDDAPADAGNS